MRLLFLAALVAIIACTQAEDKKKECRDNKDCDKNTECCATQSKYRIGACMPRAEEKEPCNAPEDVIGLWDKKFFKYCPCSGDLVCEAEETKSIPFVGDIKINERCVKSS